ncbi:MAG: hypothetical protein WC797_04595, partial [Candidatus Paceibacterota bacterium]
MDEKNIDSVVAEEAIDTVGAASGAKKTKKRKGLLDKISFFVFALTAALLPIAFSPVSINLPLDFVKSSILIVGAFLALLFWLLARLDDGEVVLPASPIFWSLVAVFIVTLVSGLLSGAMQQSIIGSYGEMGTVISLFALLVMLGLSFHFFVDPVRRKIILSALGLSLALVFLSQLSQVFLGWPFSGGKIVGAIGKWNDLGIIFGLLAVSSMTFLEICDFKTQKSKYALVLLVLSSLGAVVVNFYAGLVVVGVLALVVLLYSLFFTDIVSDKKYSGIIKSYAFWVLIVFVVAVLASDYTGILLSKVGIASPEVRPSLSATWQISEKSLVGNYL